MSSFLEEAYPSVAELWHPTKNSSDTLNSVLTNSGRVFWWIGKCGHEWENIVRQQTKLTSPCPFCSGRKLLKGLNDLTTTHPEVALFWDSVINITFAEEVLSKNKNTFSWRCESNHTWKKSIVNQVKFNSCPICAGRVLSSGVNDLGTLHPELIREWDFAKNVTLPGFVLGNSTEKVGWVCHKENHEWETSIRARVNGTGCPFCAGNRTLKGYNDLQTLQPALSKEWHPTKNGQVTPSQVASKSGPKRWWLCKNNHEWEAPPLIRVTQNTGCPVCAGRKVDITFNSLSTVYPALSKEWHPTKNGNMSPKKLTQASAFKAWWICGKNHEWEARVYNRTKAGTSSGTNCPICWISSSESNPEQLIYDFLSQHKLKVIRHDRSILTGRELDLYLPDNMFAIEYNGLYWHSENRKLDAKYHWNKWKQAKEKGIRLIQIWEDDWLRNPDLILSLIGEQLGLNVKEKQVSGDAIETALSKKEAEAFFAEATTQAKGAGKHWYGIKDASGNTVAAMNYSKSSTNVLTIENHAALSSVTDGFKKLLDFAISENNPNSIVIYDDNCANQGYLYEKLGFCIEREIEPDYMYIYKKIQRKSKLYFTKAVFQSKIEFKYIEGLDEKELGELNKLSRIWDAGKTKYRLKLKDV